MAYWQSVTNQQFIETAFNTIDAFSNLSSMQGMSDNFDRMIVSFK